MPCGTRAPKELLHHLPALVLRRPTVSAPPPGGLAGGAGIAVARPETTSLSMSCGTRAQDVRPGDPDGAPLLRSFLLINLQRDFVLLVLLYCVLLVMRTAVTWVSVTFGSQPRRPSYVCSGSEPRCRTSRCARPQPTPSPRYCSLTSLPDTAHCTYGYCHRVNRSPAHGGP